MGPASRSVDSCVWCGAPLHKGERLPGRIRCLHCDAATTDPWPDEAELEAAYAGAYRPEAGRFSGPGDRLLRNSRGLLARRLDSIAPPGAILDVGAGDGALLDALHERGRDATGLERAATRSDTLARDVVDVDGRWAAVVFWHSLEHLPQPARALEHAARLLAPGGVVVVAVPNAASIQARLFGGRWLGLDAPRHLVHLSSGALLRRLAELGLAAGRVSYLRGGQVAIGWLDGLVGLLPGRPSLWNAVRRPGARYRRLSPAGRVYALLAGAVLLPVALLATGAEAALRRGGTVYVEARAAE